jgi:hypothetical protein
MEWGGLPGAVTSGEGSKDPEDHDLRKETSVRHDSHINEGEGAMKSE